MLQSKSDSTSVNKLINSINSNLAEVKIFFSQRGTVPRETHAGFPGLILPS